MPRCASGSSISSIRPTVSTTCGSGSRPPLAGRRKRRAKWNYRRLLNASSSRSHGMYFGLDAGSVFVQRLAQVVIGLQVHPELRAGAEQQTQPDRRIGRDRPPLADNLIHPLGGNPQLLREMGLAPAERLQVFLA